MTGNKVNSHNIILLVCLLCASGIIHAQERFNPLTGQRWYGAGAGLNNADGTSAHVLISHASRSDYIITTHRIAFSYELISRPEDSCTVSKSNALEYGLLWGDGWAGRAGYLCAGAGFGINLRSFCDDTILDTVYTRHTRITLGVPLQAEAALHLSGHWFAGVGISANWNFLQPYAGALLFAAYRPAKRMKAK